MKKEIGVWLDHREAIIVVLTESGEEVKHIQSKSEKRIRYSGSSHSKTPEGLKEVTSEDQRDRKYGNTLNAFYDEIIASLRDANSIQIFGPGEAKGELGKRINHDGLKADILAVETVDKMTDRQISAKVRQHFSPKHAPEKLRQKKHAVTDQHGDARKKIQGYREQ